MDESKNPDHIDELKKRLDSHGGGMILHKREGILHDTHQNVATDWNIKNDNVRKATQLVERTLSENTMFKKFFIASIVFFAVAIFFSLYIFLGGGNTVSSKYIDINVVGSAYTSGGDELPLQILVTNKNPVAIELADLFIEYPKGTRGDAGGDIVRLLKPVGSISSGGTVTIPVTPTLYGEQGAIQEIKMRLEYRVGGSNAIFTKEKKYGVTISTAPISISVVAPTEATSNERVVFAIKVTSNTQQIGTNTRLHVTYPPGFQFESAEPRPLSGNSLWDLGDLEEGMEREIKITGTILGSEGDEKTFRIEGGSQDTSDQTSIGVIYNSLIHTLSIKRPFIEARVLVGGQDGDTFTTSGTAPVRVSIEYANNLPVRMTDVEIIAKISGNAFNPNAVVATNSYYDSSAGTVSWSKNTMSQLATLNPSDKGTLMLTLTPLSLIRPGGTFIRDPQIVIDVSIKGRQPSEGNTVAEVNSADKTTVRVATDFQMLTKALYSSGPFVNSGPVPPKAGQDTTYTIVWTLKNTANPISGGTVSTSLPLWVDFVGTSSPSSESLSFDEPSRIITWNIGSVDRGVGFGSNAREVAFQVKLRASSSQINSSPALVLQQQVTGVDSFTQSPISFTRPEINTKLSNDPVYANQSMSGLVIQ